jgi:hypothetical protein
VAVNILGVIVSVACNSQEQLCESQPRNQEAEKFSLLVTLDDYAYSQGEPITVTVTVLVLDEGQATVGYENISNPMHNYDLTLVNQYGQSVPLTEAGMKLASVRPSHVGWLLNKDAPWRDSFQLDDLFDLSEPGTYTLTLKKNVWTSVVHELTGNPVTFTRLP